MAYPRLLLNPSAARGRAESGLRRALAQTAFEVRRVVSAEQMAREARDAADEGLDRLFVAGGDGTIHHAIQGLAGSSCALGIIPSGTGNDLARSLGIELDPSTAVRRALDGRPRPIDLGSVGGRRFACVAGVGIDGDVAEIVARPSRKIRGPLAYVWALMQALRQFVAPELDISWDDGSFQGKVTLAAMANGPLFGGGMRIAPAAVIDDGLLDGVIVGRVSTPVLLALFPRIYSGRHVDHPAVRTFRSRSVTLRSRPARRVWADGEPLIRCEQARITVGRHALRVLV